MPQSCQAMCKSNGSSGVTRQRARSTQNVQLDYWVRIRPIHNIGIICYLHILYNYIADVLFKYLMDIDVSGHLRKKIKVLRTDGGGGAFFTFLIGIVVVIVGMCTKYTVLTYYPTPKFHRILRIIQEISAYITCVCRPLCNGPWAFNIHKI